MTKRKDALYSGFVQYQKVIENDKVKGFHLSLRYSMMPSIKCIQLHNCHQKFLEQISCNFMPKEIYYLSHKKNYFKIDRIWFSKLFLISI